GGRYHEITLPAERSGDRFGPAIEYDDFKFLRVAAGRPRHQRQRNVVMVPYAARYRGADRTRVGFKPCDEVLAGLDGGVRLHREADVLGEQLRDGRNVRDADGAAA